MKTKLLNALKEGYKNLGLAETAFERVATFGETFITSDEQIAEFVKKAEPMLKAEQSAADKVRTELNAKIKGLEGEKADLEAKLNGNKDTDSDMAKLIADAVAAAVAPLNEKLTEFEATNAQKSAVAALDELKNTWDYAKGYPEECEYAYDITMAMYEAGGKKMNADELTTKFKERFNAKVAKKGVDTSKPFEGSGGGPSEEEANKSFADEIRKALGKGEE